MDDSKLFGAGDAPVWDLAPASEVRRRGQQRVRRRRAAIGAAGAVLSALVVVPLHAIGFNPLSDPPDRARDVAVASDPALPEPALEDGWLQGVPADVVLDAGMTGGRTEVLRGQEASIAVGDCEAVRLPTRGSVVTQGSHGSDLAATERRVLTVFEDGARAEDAYGALRRSIAPCVRRGWDAEQMVAVETGSRGFVWASVFRRAQSAGAYVLSVQVGNSVLVATGAMEEAGPRAEVPVPRPLLQTVRTLCAFDRDPC
ncbi:hypothetical protein [Nocardioides sp. SYSU D00065]|uniref:hypothetical protein n=1 Tax=Nocardioides sp. SYSU D00065 TaxID=2817378 RepID=UPI001B3206F2|nr:hypothetical protein [Nocardioides sp. SYSU D00065]